MTTLKLVENTIILGEREYAVAIDTVIAQAEQKLLIFDQDFSIGDFASLKRYALIQSFLNKSVTSKLTIILQDSNFFSTSCPRFFDLLKTYGHKMTVYETNTHAKIAKDCFILADNNCFIRRFHIDQARFKFSMDDRETTQSLANRFDELQEETSHTISPTKLGL
jgi:hypothetical protein